MAPWDAVPESERFKDPLFGRETVDNGSRAKEGSMESHAKLLGHPVHPMLIVFPLGLFISAVAFDLVHLWTNNDAFAVVSFWNIAGGLIGGLLAAVFGLIDWMAIPRGTRAKRIGLVHGVGNVGVVALFALSLWLRSAVSGYVPGTAAVGLAVAGFALGGFTGWLGGELVDRLGVGVDDGAHVDAPSSLASKRITTGTSRRPA
jgi:uncharacterized membrane protein